MNYAYVPKPDRQPYELPQFDHGAAVATGCCRWSSPDYNSIDSVDSQNTLRFGLRNKFQTKRARAGGEPAELGVYTDWRLQPTSGPDDIPGPVLRP
jgi:hypothetical protein